MTAMVSMRRWGTLERGWSAIAFAPWKVEVKVDKYPLFETRCRLLPTRKLARVLDQGVCTSIA